ncbi:hypothetical protein BCR15_07300 [Tessaracoccus lapidicaptus]|uniref:Aldehyde dehydrogenase domain-containing protein n=1 Tax=Tessaracoccus lapidicaptus TaxID=1427523 RepID=A0A1C0AKD3_9ACTN|nr:MULTISPECIES: aldehyde dehydrogenase family protein [Tessaracoccus]AQX16864.1 acetaldehyde dehydrogenase [Tessaracoccus sp. T2.5-30]OCL33074.1 hypothetical protein BCR15_07300 [Tessaracoccus lapidicaptus]VEP41653.1 Aldehyde-alcohol dehydrogenase [Tessaracoccus lapidicaptus]
MPQLDKDLSSIQQARTLATRAREAMRSFQFATQDEVDRICEAMVAAVMREAPRLGQMAHDETGFGYPAHKQLKTEFAAQGVWNSIKDAPTCGVLRRDESRGIVEIGWPVGVICALTPSTNPTSTAVFKALIGVKARNAVVVAPHPSARKCTAEAVRVMAEAGEAAGMPAGLLSCMTEVTVQGTNELMSHYATSMILATGGPGMVKAAHSVGKPAHGVGPGNVPAYVDRSADIEQAATMIVESKSFDCSTICATEQSVIADAPIADRLRSAMEAKGAHWLTRDQAEKLLSRMFRPNGLMNAEYVGRSPQDLAREGGIDGVPASARILVADLDGIGAEYPLSREKLTTLLGFMTVADAKEGRQRAGELLRFGGDGHTMVIHATDDEVIYTLGVMEPAFRIVVNSWGSLGAIGSTTDLMPSLTLAPGGVGGAVVSDNITLQHVLNVKRLAYHQHEAPAVARAHGGSGASGAGSSGLHDSELVERLVSAVLKELKK